MSDIHPIPPAPPDEVPRLTDLATKPNQPIVLRPVGYGGEMIGMNTDCFTLGTVAGADAPLPEPLTHAGEPLKLRFVHAAEGWRVTLVEGASLFINQTLSTGGSPLRSGDVLRLVPGGPGLQFTLTHGKAESVARLAARHAPRLMSGHAESTPGKSPAPIATAAGGWKSSPALVLNFALGAAALVAIAALTVWFLRQPSGNAEPKPPVVESPASRAPSL